MDCVQFTAVDYPESGQGKAFQCSAENAVRWGQRRSRQCSGCGSGRKKNHWVDGPVVLL